MHAVQTPINFRLFYVFQRTFRKVGGNGIITMETFSGKTIDITLKNHHTWGCPVYVLDARLPGNIARLPKWET